MEQGCAVWITGLPASGKSSVAEELARMIRERGIPVIVLESDALRDILTPQPGYGTEERDRFYGILAELGTLLTRSGVPVIFDATANRRAYRDRARAMIPRFLEVFLDCPLEVCKERDPKGIYARAVSGAAISVPGIQAPYEPPLEPEIVLDCRDKPAQGAAIVFRKMIDLGFLPLSYK